MTRRARPHYRGGSPISAAKQNLTNAEIGRLTGLNTSGVQNGAVVHDATPGRVALDPPITGHWCIFEIVSVNDTDPDDIVARCLVRHRPCGCLKVRLEDEGGAIFVHDPTGCFFYDEEPEDFEGRMGWAHFMVADNAVDPTPTCEWAVFSLCCPPE